jgi:DNA-binding MarR family transcriptional regulator
VEFPMAGPFLAHTYAWRSRNPGRVLANALRRFEERVLELMREAGHTGIQRSHIHLTRHLDIEGTRITELARRAAMTNAAMTELIDLCSARGLVERIADPADARVRIVRFTPVGLAWLDAFGRAVADAEREMAAVIGPQVLAKLVPALARYGGEADPGPPTDGRSGPA